MLEDDIQTSSKYRSSKLICRGKSFVPQKRSQIYPDTNKIMFCNINTNIITAILYIHYKLNWVNDITTD